MQQRGEECGELSPLSEVWRSADDILGDSWESHHSTGKNRFSEKHEDEKLM